jgi:hypothetical protein
VEAKGTVLVNHCEHSQEIGDKKKLLFHIQKYCQLNQLDEHKLIPRTVHLSKADIEAIKQAGSMQELISERLGQLR